MTPAFFLQTKKGHGFSRFSGRRNADRYACRSCGPTSVSPTLSLFRYLYNPHTRSTLRDNRVQRERWGNYTISLLRTAKREPLWAVSQVTKSESQLYCSVTPLFSKGKLFYQGLSARVSDNRSLHAVVTDVIAEEKRRLLGL